MKTQQETATEADTSAVAAGRHLTLDELATELSAIDLRLRQLARAAEVPSSPVELTDVISSLRSTASTVREHADRMSLLARIVAGDVQLATTFATGDPWGVAARTSDRLDFGGPAIVPTVWQLLRLAQDANRPGCETTTYPEAMDGIGIGWESKAASARRRRERDAAVENEVLTLECTSCKASEGEQCKTKSGWAADRPHAPRQRQAEAAVDERLGYLGANPVAVPDALTQ
ncbi:zinc finger domain-containing protein [Streptomyces rubiginosohelvolus]|uniref:zinc finger domain-containing protein n=1 Tax=Streptomyces rubiginosohelvolus TaxID=67362 RepID=UPI0035D5A816